MTTCSKKIHFFILFILLLLPLSSVLAIGSGEEAETVGIKHPFTTPQAQELAERLLESTKLRLQHPAHLLDNDEAWNILVELNTIQISKMYDQLSRQTISAEDMVEIKYMVLHWRKATANYILKILSRRIYIPSLLYQRSVELLLRLGRRLSEEELTKVNRALPWDKEPQIKAKSQALFSELVAAQGDPLSAKKFNLQYSKDPHILYGSGPLVLLEEDLSGYKMLRLEQWATKDSSYENEFGRYLYRENGDGSVSTLYRNVEFKSGDIFLVHFNTAGDGLFSFIGSPKPFMTHVSQFILLEVEGRLVPAVIEMSLLGIRAVPLSTFLQANLTNYVEIYRLKNRPQNWHKGLNREVLKLLNEEHGYDFTANEKERKYLSCPEVPGVVFERTCVGPVQEATTISPELHDTLKAIGFPTEILLSPSDYARDPRFKFVGKVDNNNFKMLIVNELVNDYVVHHLTYNRIDETKLPSRFETVQGLVEGMQSEGLEGGFYRFSLAFLKFLGGLVKFKPDFNMASEDQMPFGSPKLVGFLAVLDEAIAQSFPHCDRQLNGIERDDQLFSLTHYRRQLYAREANGVNRAIQGCLEEIWGWTTPAPR